MHLNSLQIIADALELKVSTLRVYIAHDYFPIVKVGNRVFVNNETFENLKWMKEQGFPLSQYALIDYKPHKDSHTFVWESMVIDTRDPDWQTKGYDPKAGTQSGLGGDSNDYQTPEYLVLTKPDKSYVPELIKELQQTIKEQELTIEKLEKTEYRQGVNIVKQFEKYDALIKDFNKLNKQWETKYEQLKNQSKSKSIDSVKQTNDTLIANKEYTKEEDTRLKQMLDDIIKGQNKPG